MPHKTWAVGEEVIQTDFQANVADQVVATFSSAATRATQWPSPPTGAVSYLEDTPGALFVYYAGAWHGLGSGVSPIATQTLAAPAAIVTFDAIPQTFTHLQVIGTLRGTDAAAAFCAMRINNDSAGANNYYNEQILAQNAPTPTFAQAGVQQNYATVGLVPPSGAPAGAVGPLNVDLPNYRLAGIMRTFRWQGALNYFGSLRTELGAGGWIQTAAVTRLDFFPTGGTFAVGTSLTLSGIT